MTRHATATLLPIIALAVLGPGAPAAADNGAKKPACSAAGINWKADPVYAAAEHPSDRNRPARTDVVCDIIETIDLPTGDGAVRLTRGKLYHEKIGGVVLPVEMIDIARVDASGPRSMGRVLLADDPFDRQIRFAPQVRTIGDAVLIRISARHKQLFRIESNVLSSMPAEGWREGIESVLPENARSGVTLSVDLDRMEGRVALRGAGKEPSQGRLPSAYDENSLLVAKLAWRNNQLVADSTTITTRKPGDEPELDIYREMDEDARKAAKNLPDGVEPCSLGAWSIDTDPKGLNVRAAPDSKAQVLGIVPPPRKMPKSREAFGPEPVRSEFKIVGAKDGWFLIDKIEAPGVPYDEVYPRNLPQPFKGRGWVNGRMVGAALANGGLPEGRLYASPHVDSASQEIMDKHGNRIGADTPPRRLLACSGWWGLVEMDGGQRGWWRSLCSNQVTNCS
jgi:hypothetical protein